MRTSFRKTVLLRAYHIMNETGKDWADCLRNAWQLYRINKEMHHGEVTFYFEKVDGDIRCATGTLKIDYEFKTQNQPNPKVFTYFDVNSNSFKCFKISNFIGLAPTYENGPKEVISQAEIGYVKPTPKILRNRRKHLRSA